MSCYINPDQNIFFLFYNNFICDLMFTSDIRVHRCNDHSLEGFGAVFNEVIRYQYH